MNLTRTWQRRLSVREPDLVMLAMVNPYGIDPAVSPEAFGLSPGTIRIGTERADVSADGMTLPFAPWLAEWPLVEERYAPQDRRSETAETSLSIMGGAGLARTLRQTGGGQTATAQVVLWSPRLPLSEAIVMLAGPVSGVPDAPELDGPVALTVTDGDPDRSVEFPPGPITRGEFGGGVPDHVAGVAQRQWIFGGYPWQVPCPQLDADGLVYYVHEGEASQDPTLAWNFGAELASGFRAETRQTLASGATYTALVFDEPPLTPDGLVATVSCAGGRGVEEANPALFLLETVGGYRLTPRARQALTQSPFLFDLLLNQRGDVRSIVAGQLIPQTDLVMSFRHGMIDVLPLSAVQSETRLGRGYGLQYRLARQEPDTPLASVYNAFEILCGRNASARSGSLVQIRRDVDAGGDEIRSLCRRSQKAYGRREYPGGWPAHDLAIVQALDGSLGCPSGERLGDVLVRAHAFPWRHHGYRASWLEGMALEIGQRAFVTDPAEGLADAPTVAARRIVRPTGVDVVFAAQAIPAATTTTQRKVFANG